MTINKTRIYTFTAIAAALFFIFGIVFADDFWFGPLFGEHYVTDGTWMSWLMLAIIIGAGIMQAQRFGDKEIDLEPESSMQTNGQVDDPKIWRLLLGNIHFAILWLPFRFFLGKEWLAAGEHKIRDGAWMDGGQALLGYWNNAVAIPAPDSGRRPAITYDWFRDFLTYMINHEWYTWFAKLVAIGEFMIGLGLIVGALVGIAAFFGTVLNLNFMLAGTTSSNPVLFGMTVFLVLAWKVAGHFGLDRWLLPILGTPWNRDRTNRATTDPKIGNRTVQTSA
jgi:thiosulfate dehydrogenase [quinone] large subunit